MDSVLISDARYLEMQAFMAKKIKEIGLDAVLVNQPLRALLFKLSEIGKEYVMKAMPTKLEGKGFDQGKQFIVVYPQGMKKEELNGNVGREAVLSQNLPS